MRLTRSPMFILLAVLALVLAACAEDDGSTAETLEPISSGSAIASFDEGSFDATPSASGDASDMASFDADASTSPSIDADESASPGSSLDASPSDDDGLTDSCSAAFEDVGDLSRIDSLQQFQDVLDALTETIDECESVEAWTQEAEDRLGLANIDLDARDFLERQCERDEIEDSELCEEL